MNGTILANLLNVFTLTIPGKFASEKNLSDTITFRVQFVAANRQYKDTYFLQRLTGNNEGTMQFSYVGIVNPIKAELVLTQKSPCSAESVEGNLFKRMINCMFNGEIKKMQDAGFNVLLGSLNEAQPQQPTTNTETETAPIDPQALQNAF